MLAAAMPVSLPPAVRAAAAVAVLAGLAALTRASSWRKPLATDTGQYLYIGDLILDGGTPYVDAVNNKGPMTYVLFAGIRLGAGTSMTAVRIALLAFAVIAALALGAYVAHYAGRAAGVLAAVGFALFAGLPAFQGDDPNTEQIGIAFVVGSWWLATRPGRWWAVGAGAAAAAADGDEPGAGADPAADRVRGVARGAGRPCGEAGRGRAGVEPARARHRGRPRGRPPAPALAARRRRARRHVAPGRRVRAREGGRLGLARRHPAQPR